ncbi:MAG: hypothetical protein U1E50_19055, partial [Caulobacteraceae bacterium]
MSFQTYDPIRRPVDFSETTTPETEDTGMFAGPNLYERRPRKGKGAPPMGIIVPAVAAAAVAIGAGIFFLTPKTSDTAADTTPVAAAPMA